MELVRPFSQRLLTVLQLTRMALVFTAISNSLCALMLWSAWQSNLYGGHPGSYLAPSQLIACALMSIGLYGFGMSLNDIIDRRRDRQIASDRPLPSGRIGVPAAHAIAAMLGTLALASGIYIAQQMADDRAGMMSVALLVWTAALIAFYDFAGKYLVTLGLWSLGLIRFFHATVPAPQLPLLWHPLLLLNHVTILSTVCYHLENKRPTLTRLHWYAVFGGLIAMDAALIVLVGTRRAEHRHVDLLHALWVTPQLMTPAVAVATFLAIAILIRAMTPDRRAAGRTLMLWGLLWLIVYDASFTLAYVGALPAFMLMMLLPAAWLSVQLMRWWSKVLSLSQKPEYQRAR